MSTVNSEERLMDAPYEDFVNRSVRKSKFIIRRHNFILYSRSIPARKSKIRIGSLGQEYKLPKDLLCKQSPYFKATFEGDFQEGEEQSTCLSEDDVVRDGAFKC